MLTLVLACAIGQFAGADHLGQVTRPDGTRSIVLMDQSNQVVMGGLSVVPGYSVVANTAGANQLRAKDQHRTPKARGPRPARGKARRRALTNGQP